MAEQGPRGAELEWALHLQICPKCSHRKGRCAKGNSIWGKLVAARQEALF